MQLGPFYAASVEEGALSVTENQAQSFASLLHAIAVVPQLNDISLEQHFN